MTVDHRPPCVLGSACGEPSACPPEYPSDAQGPANPQFVRDDLSPAQEIQAQDEVHQWRVRYTRLVVASRPMRAGSGYRQGLLDALAIMEGGDPL